MEGIVSSGGNYDVSKCSVTVPGDTTPLCLNQDYTFYQGSRRLIDKANGLPRHTETTNMLFADGHVKNSASLPAWTSGGSGRVTEVEQVIPYAKYVIIPGSSAASYTSWLDTGR